MESLSFRVFKFVFHFHPAILICSHCHLSSIVLLNENERKTKKERELFSNIGITFKVIPHKLFLEMASSSPLDNVVTHVY